MSCKPDQSKTENGPDCNNCDASSRLGKTPIQVVPEPGWINQVNGVAVTNELGVGPACRMQTLWWTQEWAHRPRPAEKHTSDNGGEQKDSNDEPRPSFIGRQNNGT